MLNMEEVNQLIAASHAPYPQELPAEVDLNYQSYTEEETIALIEGRTFKPKKTKKKK